MSKPPLTPEQFAEFDYRAKERIGIMVGAGTPTPEQVDLAKREALQAVGKNPHDAETVRRVYAYLEKIGWVGLVVLSGFILATSFAGQSVTLAWDPNAETNLAGYRLYYGTGSRSYAGNVTTTNTTATVTGLVAGTTYYFAATAFITDGLESDYSEEVTYQVPDPLPLVTAWLEQSCDPAGPWDVVTNWTANGMPGNAAGFFRVRLEVAQ